MKRIAVSFLAITMLMAVSLTAQEKAEETKTDASEHAMMPPPGLSDEWTKWMVGEWEGTSMSPMGTSKDWVKCELGLDGQFVMMQATGTMEDGTTYKGMGAQTLTPTGEIVGYWIDNWRGMYEGKGKVEGDKFTMVWEGQMGKAERTIVKVGDDKLTIAEKFTMPDGNMMESSGEMSRKTMMTDKK